MPSNKSIRTGKLLTHIFFALIIAFAGFCEWTVYERSNQRATLKEEFSQVNEIEHGLLSVNSWEDQIKSIIVTQIDTFSLTRAQDSVLRAEVSDILNELISKADSVVQNNDDTFGKKLRKMAVNLFVDKEELREQVPGFSAAVISELQKPESKERLKKVAVQKLEQFAESTYGDEDSSAIEELFVQHDVADKKAFNELIENKSDQYEASAYRMTFAILALILLALLPWIVVRKKKWRALRKPLFNLSVILAATVLITGISTSMIEIDARIERIDFTLLGEQIQFEDQMLFYRSKSILEVVDIMLNTGKADSILVGILILAFSVLFPLSKLIATEVLIFTKGAISRHWLTRWLALQSGKWSMADVMVVAIFMAFVGFRGILDNQMKDLTIDTDSLTSIATNQTSLRPGFILFLAFVLFSLTISMLLKHTTPDEEEA